MRPKDGTKSHTSLLGCDCIAFTLDSTRIAVCCTGFSRLLTEAIPPKGGTTNGVSIESQPLRELSLARPTRPKNKVISWEAQANLLQQPINRIKPLPRKHFICI
jgi:hypothetical protein